MFFFPFLSIGQNSLKKRIRIPFGSGGFDDLCLGAFLSSTTSTYFDRSHAKLRPLPARCFAICWRAILQMVLECLCDFMSEPTFLVELYVNYDCDSQVRSPLYPLIRPWKQS